LKRLLLLLLIVSATFAVYLPSLKNGYVWDDSALIQRDPFIRSWRLIPEGFRHFLFTDATASDFYRPIQRLTYTWDYAWAAFQPRLYHFDNILIHALAAAFLFLFVEKLLVLCMRPRPAECAFLVAILWAIHPLWTSAVCYISGRADPLAAMFGFCGLWLALLSTHRTTLLAALMFLLAFLSKESGIIFLPICAVLFIFGRPYLRLPRCRIVHWLLYTALILVISLTLRLSAEHTPPPPSTPLALAARPIVALRAFAEYAGLFILPVNLHMERDVLPFGRGDLATTLHLQRNREFQTLLGAILVAAYLGWLRWSWKIQERSLSIALVAALIAYLPICGLFSLNASVAEHWLYIPGAFLILAVVITLSRRSLFGPAGVHFRITPPGQPPREPAPVAGFPLRPLYLFLLLLWAAYLGARTYIRSPDWHDQRTFLERTIADGGDTARMYINLGALDLDEGDTPTAISHLKFALTLTPDQPFALISLGSAYLRLGQFDLARQQFEAALAHPITAPEALQDIAVLEYKQNHADRMDLLENSALLAPRDWPIRKRLILHYAERGQNVAAMTSLRAIVADQPWRADAWKLLGDFWLRLRQPDSAARAYTKAVQLDVHDDDSAQKLAALRSQESP
jgi:Flp pilus assembly protein TadD